MPLGVFNKKKLNRTIYAFELRKYIKNLVSNLVNGRKSYRGMSLFLFPRIFSESIFYILIIKKS